MDLRTKMRILNFQLGILQRHRQDLQKRAKFIDVVVKMELIMITMNHIDAARVKILQIDYFRIFLYADSNIILILHETYVFNSKNNK